MQENTVPPFFPQEDQRSDWIAHAVGE